MKQDETYINALFELILTGHWITDQVGTLLKPYGISEPQYNVLRILKGQKGEPITVQEIQKRMVQKSSNVTRIVDKLIDKGLVNREQCPTNRRKMDITLTELGGKELKRFDKVVEDFHEPMEDNLSVEEAKQLNELIKKLKGSI